MSFLEISETESFRSDYVYDTASKLCLLIERKGYERLEKLPKNQLLKFDEYGVVYQMLRESMVVVADNNDYIVEFEKLENQRGIFLHNPRYFENGDIVQFHSENSLEDWPELAALLECDHYKPDPRNVREMIEGYITGVFFEITTGEVYHSIRTHQTDEPRDVIIDFRYISEVKEEMKGIVKSYRDQRFTK